MSYEIDKIKTIDCLCGKGKIKQVFKSNDWNQTKEEITIECEECQKNYIIVRENLCLKPKRNYTVYFCKNKNTGEKIELNL